MSRRSRVLYGGWERSGFGGPSRYAAINAAVSSAAYQGGSAGAAAGLGMHRTTTHRVEIINRAARYSGGNLGALEGFASSPLVWALVAAGITTAIYGTGRGARRTALLTALGAGIGSTFLFK